ncbi:MAG: cytochrome c, partial [Anaerolineales bacterium]|nr:cytochrome c [Anaerolineales bacterium]MCX7756158.1 cytochrome c [Anaerolineales bacterium]
MRFVSIVFLSFLLTGCISLAEDVTPPPGYMAPTPAPTLSAEVFPASSPDVNSGAAIYAEKCAPCHGVTGQGDGPQAAQLPVVVPPLGRPDYAFDKSPVRWYQIVTQGNLQNFMPGFTSLSDQQRWDVVAYALSLSVSAEQVQA